MCAHDWANGAAASLDDVLLVDAVAVAVASSTATAAPASNQTRLSMRTLLSYSTPRRRPSVVLDDRASAELRLIAIVHRVNANAVQWRAALRGPHPGTRKRN